MKPVTTVAALVFALVAVLQFLRVVLGWEITVNGSVIPIWASVVACVAAAALSVMLWRETRA